MKKKTTKKKNLFTKTNVIDYVKNLGGVARFTTSKHS